MMKILKSKKGEGTYIYLCVLILVISMLLSVLILYMGLCAQVQIQKRDMKHKLDGYISDYATIAFNAVKQGEAYEVYVDYENLANGCLPSLGFTQSDSVYRYDNGNCTLIGPEVKVLRGEGFGITLHYTAVFPIVWNGKTYGDLSIPVTVSSYYKINSRL